jgi:tRNA nucleotidyltransferase (CCA-adding enzyme)
MVLGREPRDYDIATQATPAQVKVSFGDVPVIDTGLRYGTVTVVWERVPVEVTAFRADGDYGDGRRPNYVTFTRDIAHDLARRDFTVNAMAYRPPGTFVDPYNGADDCRAQVIRCVGDPPQRFREDSLRVLRALRFAAVLGFGIEPRTQRALRDCAPLMQNIAAERITAELAVLLSADRPARVLRGSRAVFAALAPQWAAMGSGDWQARCKAVALVRDRTVRLAVLCMPAVPSCLRLDNATRQRVNAMLRSQASSLPDTMDEMAHQIAAHGAEYMRDAVRFHIASGAAAQNREALLDAAIAGYPCLSLKQLAVNGSDAVACGVPPGPVVGHVLHELLRQVIGGELPNERGALQSAMRTHFTASD